MYKNDKAFRSAVESELDRCFDDHFWFFLLKLLLFDGIHDPYTKADVEFLIIKMPKWETKWIRRR